MKPITFRATKDNYDYILELKHHHNMRLSYNQILNWLVSQHRDNDDG